MRLQKTVLHVGLYYLDWHLSDGTVEIVFSFILEVEKSTVRVFIHCLIHQGSPKYKHTSYGLTYGMFLSAPLESVMRENPGMELTCVCDSMSTKSWKYWCSTGVHFKRLPFQMCLCFWHIHMIELNSSIIKPGQSTSNIHTIVRMPEPVVVSTSFCKDSNHYDKFIKHEKRFCFFLLFSSLSFGM